MGLSSSKGSFSPSTATYETDVVDAEASFPENFSGDYLAGPWLEDGKEETDASEENPEDNENEFSVDGLRDTSGDAGAEYNFFAYSLQIYDSWNQDRNRKISSCKDNFIRLVKEANKLKKTVIDWTHVGMDLRDNLSPAKKYMAAIDKLGDTFKNIKQDHGLNSKFGSKVHYAMAFVPRILDYRKRGGEMHGGMDGGHKVIYDKWEWLRNFGRDW